MADGSGLKCVATVEARMTSSRLPGKVLLPAAGRPLLEILVERLRRAPGLDGVVIATTVNAGDDPISELGEKLGVEVFRGSENDVLGRVCGALRSSGADVCVENTCERSGRNPFLVAAQVFAQHVVDGGITVDGLAAGSSDPTSTSIVRVR